MRRVVLTCALFAALIVSVAAHARLTATNGGGGIGWQPNPANGGGCGGSGTVSTTPYAVWAATNTITLYWQVIAGDGAGAITINIDTTGSATVNSFTGNLAVTSITQDGNPTVGYHAFTFTVPNGFDCSGGSGAKLCHVQFKGANNWVSCLTVSSDSAQSGNTANNQPLCGTASGLSFCNMVVGSIFLNPQGTTVADMDAAAQATHTAYLANRNVFSLGSADSTGKCSNALKWLICESMFGKCHTQASANQVAPCHATCRAATCACGLNKTHNFLFDCDASLFAYGSADNIANPACDKVPDPLAGKNGADAVSSSCAYGVNNPPDAQYNGNGVNCNQVPLPPGCGACALLASPILTIAAVAVALVAQKRLL